MISLRNVAILLCLLWSADAALDETVCKPVTENFGYFPPDPPTSFIMKNRKIFVDMNASVLEETYFDATKQRILQIDTRGGASTRYIKDFRQKLYITISETYDDAGAKNPNCQVNDMSTEWNVNDGFNLLRYGLEHFRQTKAPTKVRGIPVTPFQGCYYANTITSEETINVTYTWQLKAIPYLSAFQSVQPYYSSFVGSNTYDGGQKAPVNIRNEIFWYQEDPIFREEDFQIPSNYFCQSAATAAPGRVLDMLKKSHYAEVENIVQYYEESGLRQIMHNFRSWRSYKHDLARVQYYTTDNTKGEGTVFYDTWVDSVQDFKAGIAYVYSYKDHICKVVPLDRIKGSPDVSDRGGAYRMSGQDSIVEKYKWSYEMKEKFRNLPVEVWMSNLEKSTFEKRPMTSTLKMTFLSDKWVDYSNKKLPRNLPLSIVRRVDFLDYKLPQHKTITSNIFNVDEGEPSIYAFKISECFGNSSSFKFKVKSRSPITELGAFLQDSIETAQEAIANAADISVLRVDINWIDHPEDNLFSVSGAIYDPPKVDGKVDSPSLRITAEMALATLKSKLDNKNFEIDLIHPTKRFKKLKLVGVPGSFKITG